MTAASPIVLLTGFEPFGGEIVNPSQKIVETLDGRRVGSARIRSLVLPCVFDNAADLLLRKMSGLSPHVVICLGQAGGRAGIHLERVALNLDDARIPDNAGNQPSNVAIAAGGPVAYWSTLPIRSIKERLSRQGIPVAESLTAGAFVCNHVFYALMHALATKDSPAVMAAGFVHVPWLPEQSGALRGEPSLSLEAQVAAVEALVEAVLDGQSGLAAPA